jgi:hypothetical protein
VGSGVFEITVPPPDDAVDEANKVRSTVDDGAREAMERLDNGPSKPPQAIRNADTANAAKTGPSLREHYLGRTPGKEAERVARSLEGWNPKEVYDGLPMGLPRSNTLIP